MAADLSALRQLFEQFRDEAFKSLTGEIDKSNFVTSMKPVKSAPLGEFELVVLLAVVRLKDDAYPIAIRDEIERRTGRAVSRPAVFITLERLEDKGLLSSRYGDPTPVRGGRAKRFFSATKAGLTAVQQSLDTVAAMARGLEAHFKKS
jgi:PadR family transcriptional regulator, regulatory protein PadR